MKLITRGIIQKVCWSCATAKQIKDEAMMERGPARCTATDRKSCDTDKECMRYTSAKAYKTYRRCRQIVYRQIWKVYEK
jgi:hypothetical protein